MNPNDNQPTQPTEQAPQAQPTTPEFQPGIATAPKPVAQPETQTSEATPAPQPNSQETPQQTENPETPEPKPEAPQTQSYEEYLDSLTKDFATPEVPKPTDDKYKTGSDDDLVNFFADFEKSIIEKQRVENQRQQAYQQAEQKVWGDAAKKYDEIGSNSDLRDTIQNIRVGIYQNTGKMLTPTEVADQLIGTLHNQYKKGVNDTNVQTQVVNSQPMNGGGKPQPTASTDYNAVQSGNQDAVVGEVEKLIQQGLV